ncbi:MAG: DNA alkylation repair protein, partial [Oleiharenicola lentus]
MKSRTTRTNAQLKQDVQVALAELKRLSSQKIRDGMARYGIPSDKALGVGVGQIQKYGKQLGRDQALAEALWETDVY